MAERKKIPIPTMVSDVQFGGIMVLIFG